MMKIITLFTIYQLSLSQDTVECEADNQCAGQSITRSNVDGLKCTGYNSCGNANIDLTCAIGEECFIECGINSCIGATITINSAEVVKCDGCQNAIITINDPLQEFAIECKETGSCQGLELNINIPETSSITTFDSISCDAPFACQNAAISINNQASQQIMIQEIVCEQQSACDELIMDMTGNIDITECGCTPQGGCLSTIGLDACFTGLEELECTEMYCAGQELHITDPLDSFEFTCNGDYSCLNTNVTITVTSSAAISSFAGIACEGMNACDGLQLIIDNQQQGTNIIVTEIECAEIDSCKDALFSGNLAGNVVFSAIDCGGSNCGYDGSECLIESGGELLSCYNTNKVDIDVDESPYLQAESDEEEQSDNDKKLSQRNVIEFMFWGIVFIVLLILLMIGFCWRRNKLANDILLNEDRRKYSTMASVDGSNRYTLSWEK